MDDRIRPSELPFDERTSRFLEQMEGDVDIPQLDVSHFMKLNDEEKELIEHLRKMHSIASEYKDLEKEMEDLNAELDKLKDEQTEKIIAVKNSHAND